MQPSEKESGWTLLGVLGVGAGLAVYAYAAGGIVEYLRFAGEGLPATQALALLSSQQLLVIGVVVALVAVPIWATLTLIRRLWVNVEARQRNRRHEPRGRVLQSVEDAAGAGFAGALVSALAAVVLGAIEATGAIDATVVLRGVLSAVGVAGGIGAVIGIGVSGLVAAGWRGFLALPRRWITVIFLALVLVGGATLAYFVPLSMTRTVLRLSNGTCLAGLYLARDGDDIELVDGRSKRLLSIAGDELAAVQIGRSMPVDSSAVKPIRCPPLLRPLHPARSGQPAGRS